jgi:hypothetical protein
MYLSQTTRRSLSHTFCRKWKHCGPTTIRTASPQTNPYRPPVPLSTQAILGRTELPQLVNILGETVLEPRVREYGLSKYCSIEKSPNIHRLFKHLTEQNQDSALANLSKLNLSQLFPQESPGIALAVIIDTYTLQILHNIQNAICADTTTLPDDMYHCLIDLFSDSPYAVAGILTELTTAYPNLDTDALFTQLFFPYFKFSAIENKHIPKKVAAIAHTIATTPALNYIPQYKKASCTNDLFKMGLWLHEDDKAQTILRLVTQSMQDIGAQNKLYTNFFDLLHKSLLFLELPNSAPLADIPIQPNTDGFYKMLFNHF